MTAPWSDPNAPAFKVGDRVRVKPKHSRNPGRNGTVTDVRWVSDPTDRNPYYMVKIDDTKHILEDRKSVV